MNYKPKRWIEFYKGSSRVAVEADDIISVSESDYGGGAKIEMEGRTIWVSDSFDLVMKKLKRCYEQTEGETEQ